MPDHHHTYKARDQLWVHWARIHHTLAVAFVNCQLSSLRCISQSEIS